MTTIKHDIEAVFANNADVTLAVHGCDFGHAFRKAKFDGRCKLTGDVINMGESIREIAVYTHTGHRFAGFMANRTFAHLFRDNRSISFDADETSGARDVYVCDWRRAKGVDLADVVLNLQPGERFEVLKGGHFDMQLDVWFVADDGKVCRGAGYRQTRRSAKAVASGMRRRKNDLLYRVVKSR